MLAGQPADSPQLPSFPPGTLAAALPHRPIPKTFVLPGDEILPQIANGALAGGAFFFTVFEAVNVTVGPASFEVSFFTSAGAPMLLPVMQDGGTIETGMIGDAIAPGGVRFAVTVPGAEGDVRIGYAVVTSTPENSVALVAKFSNQVPGERLFQASIPTESRLHDSFFVPYTNTNGFVASLAVVSLVEQTVTFRANAPSGTEVCNTTRPFTAGEHFPFLIRDLLACTAGNNGVVEVEGEGIGLSGVGFSAADAGLGAFVTVPVYGAVPE